MAKQRPVCPVCGDDLTIAKVTAVHRAQEYGSMSSKLSQFLAPPSDDSYNGPWAWPCALVGTSIWIWLSILNLQNNSPFLGIMGLALPLLCWIGGAIGFGIGSLFRDAQGVARVEKRNAFRHARWEAAFYCSKHDITFVPGDNRTFPPTQFSVFLSQVDGSVQSNKVMDENGLKS